MSEDQQRFVDVFRECAEDIPRPICFFPEAYAPNVYSAFEMNYPGTLYIFGIRIVFLDIDRVLIFDRDLLSKDL